MADVRRPTVPGMAPPEQTTQQKRDSAARTADPGCSFDDEKTILDERRGRGKPFRDEDWDEKVSPPQRAPAVPAARKAKSVAKPMRKRNTQAPATIDKSKPTPGARFASGTRLSFDETTVPDHADEEPTVADHAEPLPPIEVPLRAKPRPALLTVITGVDATKEHRLKDDQPMVIGRAIESGFVLSDIAASRQHAEVVWTAEGYCVRDLGSGNGTMVNGKRLDGRRLLKDGDRIEIGKTIIGFAYQVSKARPLVGDMQAANGGNDVDEDAQTIAGAEANRPITQRIVTDNDSLGSDAPPDAAEQILPPLFAHDQTAEQVPHSFSDFYPARRAGAGRAPATQPVRSYGHYLWADPSRRRSLALGGAAVLVMMAIGIGVPSDADDPPPPSALRVLAKLVVATGRQQAQSAATAPSQRVADNWNRAQPGGSNDPELAQDPQSNQATDPAVQKATSIGTGNIGSWLNSFTSEVDDDNSHIDEPPAPPPAEADIGDAPPAPPAQSERVRAVFESADPGQKSAIAVPDASKHRRAHALKTAAAQYRKQRFRPASQTLRNEAKAQRGRIRVGLRKLATGYDGVAKHLRTAEKQMAKDPIAAASAYRKAKRLDAQFGKGAHSEFINNRLRTLAPRAAAAHFRHGRYEQAKRAADAAIKYGAANDQLVLRVRANLERKAGEFYRAAMAESNAGRRSKLLRRILRITPSDSPYYLKAYKRVNAGRPAAKGR